MKGIKKNLSESAEIYPTVSFGFVTPLLWKKGKTNGLCEEKNYCCDSFNEIDFQIDGISDYTN